MKDLLKKDIMIKIGSVLLAVLFWIYVYNYTNPYVPMTFTNIPLKIVNDSFLDDNGYIIKNKYKTSVDITIRGRQDAINQVRASDFEATLDFSQIKSVDDKYLKITGPFCDQKDVSIESVNPPVIDIQLARNKSNTFPVQLQNNITLKPGYKVIKTSIDPASIPIMTEEAVIDSVDFIRATLDAKDVDSDINTKLNCKVYNKDGKEMTSLSKNLTVNVQVNVAKEVPITIVTKGKPAADYIQTSGTATPGTALLTGSPDVLAKIADIKTDPVNIEGISSNLSTNATLKVPDGTKLANTAKDTAVNITVEKLETRNISLTRDDIVLLGKASDGSFNYEVKSDNIVLQLKGRAADLNALKTSALNPSVDVSNLGEGIHRLPLSINLPSQVKLMQGVTIEVRVSKAEIPQT